MAKTVKCAFCGKEMKAGLFSGEDFPLHATEFDYITCCEHCCKAYTIGDKREIKRFSAKVENYKKITGKRKLTQEELAKLYDTYFAEMNACKARNGQERLAEFAGYFHYNENGYFAVEEFELGSVITSGDMSRAIDRQAVPGICAFSGEDISRLEYRLADKLGTSAGTFTDAYLFEVRLNDPRKLSYRPCITYFVTRGSALLPHKRAQQAEASLVDVLNVLKRMTGTSARIVKIK